MEQLKGFVGNWGVRDGVDLTNDQVCERRWTSRQRLTTGAPSPGDCAAGDEKLSKESEGESSIHLGSNLSATGEAARVVALAR